MSSFQDQHEGRFIEIGANDSLSLYEAGVKIAEKIGFFKDDKELVHDLKVKELEKDIYKLKE